MSYNTTSQLFHFEDFSNPPVYYDPLAYSGPNSSYFINQDS